MLRPWRGEGVGLLVSAWQTEITAFPSKPSCHVVPIFFWGGGGGGVGGINTLAKILSNCQAQSVGQYR